MRIISLSIILLITFVSTTIIEKAEFPAVLYFWCGQNASLPNAADFVAVVDFDPLSPKYGKVLNVVSLPHDVDRLNAAGNEAHHAGLSLDYKYYITGGLLSFLKGKDEVFVWHVPNNPIEDGPRFAYSLNPPGACTDEFFPIGGSRFLLTQMCSEKAGSPGDIIEIDAAKGTFASIIANISEFENFNPHGFARAPDGSLTVTNYVLPSSILASDASQLIFRNTTVSISNRGYLQDEYSMPPQVNKSADYGSGNGFMDFKYIPGDPENRGYVVGGNDNQMYLLRHGQAPLHVYDFTYLSRRMDGRGGMSAGMISYSQDGKRMVLTSMLQWVILLDITDRVNPKPLHQFFFCNDTSILNKTFPVSGHPEQRTTMAAVCATGTRIGSHYILWPPGQNRFIVINYFLNFGLLQYPGTRTVHTFKFTDDSFTSFEYDFEFDPNDQLATMSASPHAVTYIPVIWVTK